MVSGKIGILKCRILHLFSDEDVGQVALASLADGSWASLFGTDAHAFFQVVDKDLAVTQFSGFGTFDNGGDGSLDEIVVDSDFETDYATSCRFRGVRGKPR